VIHGGTGLAPDVVRRLVEEGGSKFNLSTQIKQTYIDALHGYIADHREEYDILKVLKHAHDRIKEMIGEHISLLGSEGKA